MERRPYQFLQLPRNLGRAGEDVTGNVANVEVLPIPMLPVFNWGRDGNAGVFFSASLTEKYRRPARVAEDEPRTVG